MQVQSTRPAHSTIVLSIPDDTVRLLEHVADTRNLQIGEIAAILLQTAILEAAMADRADAMMATENRVEGRTG